LQAAGPPAAFFCGKTGKWLEAGWKPDKAKLLTTKANPGRRLEANWNLPGIG